MKREPVTIEVKPDELHVERPRRVVAVAKRKSRRVSAVRELERMARDGKRIADAVESPEFWLGIVARLVRGQNDR